MSDLGIDPEYKKPPTRPSKFGGNLATDWGQMFDLWIESGQSKRAFLGSFGMKCTSGNVIRHTREWHNNKVLLKEAARGNLPAVDVKAMGLYQMVMQWRQAQARSDYELTEAVKSHLRMILNSSVKKVAGEPDESTMKPVDLRAIATAMESTQRVQRLALGMSTENVGVDFPEPDSNVDTPENNLDGPQIPIFIVEVAESGKFKRARPRQIA